MVSIEEELKEYGRWMVKVWNENYPIGTSVIVETAFGEIFIGKTSAKATILGDTMPCVYIEGKGAWLLSRVIPDVTKKVEWDPDVKR